MASSNFRIGAMAETALTSSRTANVTSSEPFALRLQKSHAADKSLQRALLAPSTHRQLQHDLKQFTAQSMQTPAVASTMGGWAAKIVPIQNQDISSVFRESACPLFTDFSFATTLFSDANHPVAPPGPTPKTVADLYPANTSVFAERKSAFTAVLHDLNMYFALGPDAKRRCRDFKVWTQEERLPKFRGLIYETQSSSASSNSTRPSSRRSKAASFRHCGKTTAARSC